MALFNFRLFLRPTPIGNAIIERLKAEGTDRQADARRWVELGYALEQAGFRLDGTTVYHAGRVFAADQVQAGAAPAASVASESFLAEPVPSTVQPRHTAAPSSQVAEHPAAQPGKVPAPQPSVSPAPPAPPAPPATSPQHPDSDLTSNLRGLSL